MPADWPVTPRTVAAAIYREARQQGIRTARGLDVAAVAILVGLCDCPDVDALYCDDRQLPRIFACLGEYAERMPDYRE